MSRACEFDQAQVAQHLELLAYFRSHVLILRMEALEMRLKLVELLEGEASPSQICVSYRELERPARQCWRHFGSSLRSRVRMTGALPGMTGCMAEDAAETGGSRFLGGFCRLGMTNSYETDWHV